MKSRMTLIRERLEHGLQPERLEIIDETHKHVGHAGATLDRGHFCVTIVSERFRHVSSLQRHRLVYETLGDLMRTDIHALSIKALAPGE
ncbi:MAG: BolA family protein [Gammaproteobacteria bacterium]